MPHGHLYPSQKCPTLTHMFTNLQLRIAFVSLLAFLVFLPSGFCDVPHSWTWRVSDDFLGWQANNFENVTVTDHSLSGLTRYDCQLVSPKLALAAEDWPILEFRIKSDAGGKGELFFRAEDEAFHSDRQIDFTLIGDGQFHSYRIELAKYSRWKGSITQIRLDPLNPSGANIVVQGIRFLQHSPDNLLQNGDFHWSDLGESTPVGWQGKAVQIEQVGTNNVSQIRITAQQDKAIFQSDVFEITVPGLHQISIQGPAITQAPTSTPTRAEIRLFDVFHKALPTQNLTLSTKKADSPSPSDVLTTMEASFDTEAQAAYGQLVFTLQNKQALLLASVSIQGIATDASTATASSEVKKAPDSDAASKSSSPSTPAPASPVAKLTYLPGDIPAFEINGKTLPTMHAIASRDDPEMDLTILQNTRDAGIDLIWLNLPIGFEWKPDAAPDFSKIDQRLAEVTTAHPDAYFVLNVPLDPVYNPGMRKWNDLHPEELAQQEGNNSEVGGYHGAKTKAPSYASTVWLDDATAAWRALIRHVRSGPWADRVVGYAPISGISWEWFYWGSQSKDFLDYSAPFQRAFRAWLGDIYGKDITRLNRAWHSQYSDFDQIPVPTQAERDTEDPSNFLAPEQYGAVVDLHAFFAHLISDDILRFCRIVKEESDGNAICGTYYGYVIYIGFAYFGVHSGHFALHKILESPDIDFIMSPSRYGFRNMGEDSGFMTTVDSCKQHKKLYIDQIDIRTFRGTGRSGELSRIPTLQGSVEVLRREFSNCLVNGVAPQWYDFGKGWILGDTRLMQAVGQMHEIETDLQTSGRKTRDTDRSVAVIVSESSIFHNKVNSDIQNSAVNNQISPLNRAGVAWDSYLLSDLESLPDYPCYLFLNCFDLTAQQREYIEKSLKTNGKTLVWIYAPGILEPTAGAPRAETTYDPKRIADLTGFQTASVAPGPLLARFAPQAPFVEPADEKGKNVVYGYSKESSPRFIILDGEPQSLFTDDAGVAMAVKQFPNWTSVYSVAPSLPASMLQHIARLAGVPVVNERTEDVTYVSGDLFAVHSLSGGARTFRVPGSTKQVRELFSGSIYPVKDGQFDAQLQPSSTVLYSIER